MMRNDPIRTGTAYRPDPHHCRYCRRIVYGSLAYCESCWQIVMACRATLHELVRERYLEELAPRVWIIKPGAREIVQLVYEVIDQFFPEKQQSSPWRDAA